MRRVERFAKKQPTALVFEDRNRVPIENDDDSAGAEGEFDDNDEFDYPDIPVEVDDESDFGDESYSPSEDDDHGGDEELLADSSSDDDSAAVSVEEEASSAAELSRSEDGRRQDGLLVGGDEWYLPTYHISLTVLTAMIANLL